MKLILEIDTISSKISNICSTKASKIGIVNLRLFTSISTIILGSALLASCASFTPVQKPVSAGGFERSMIYRTEGDIDTRYLIASVFNEVISQSQVGALRLIESSNNGINTYEGNKYDLICHTKNQCQLTLSFLHRRIIQGSTKENIQTMLFSLAIQELESGYAARLQVPATITTKDQSFLNIQLPSVLSDGDLEAYFSRLKRIEPVLPIEPISKSKDRSSIGSKIIRKLGIFGKAASLVLDEMEKRQLPKTIPPVKTFNRSTI